MAAAKAKQAEAERDDAPDEETEAPAVAPKKKISLKLIIIAAASLLVLGGGGVAAYLFLGSSGHDKPAHAESRKASRALYYAGQPPFEDLLARIAEWTPRL